MWRGRASCIDRKKLINMAVKSEINSRSTWIIEFLHWPLPLNINADHPMWKRILLFCEWGMYREILKFGQLWGEVSVIPSVCRLRKGDSRSKALHQQLITSVLKHNEAAAHKLTKLIPGKLCRATFQPRGFLSWYRAAGRVKESDEPFLCMCCISIQRAALRRRESHLHLFAGALFQAPPCFFLLSESPRGVQVQGRN